MTIRAYAKSVGFQIVGKLTRRPEWEYIKDPYDGSVRHSGTKTYSDEGWNIYHINSRGVCIVTANDEII